MPVAKARLAVPGPPEFTVLKILHFATFNSQYLMINLVRLRF